MKKLAPIFLIIFGGIFLCGCEKFAEKDFLWEKYAAAKINFQNNFYDFLQKKLPAEKKILENKKNEQIFLIKKRGLEFYFLQKNFPEKINRSAGISEFINFDFEKKDEKILAKKNKKYKKICAEIENLRDEKISNSAREKILKLQKSAEIKKILADFKNEIVKLEKNFLLKNN